MIFNQNHAIEMFCLYLFAQQAHNHIQSYQTLKIMLFSFFIYFLVRAFHIFIQNKYYQMKAGDLEQNEESLITQIDMPENLQYQYTYQQNLLPENHHFRETILDKQSQIQAFVRQEMENSGYQTTIVQQTDPSAPNKEPLYEIFSKEQYRRMLLKNQELMLSNEELNKKLEQSKRESKKSSQNTQDEKGKKQVDVQDPDLNTPYKRKTISSTIFSKKMTEKQLNKISHSQNDQLAQQLGKYKLMLQKSKQQYTKSETKVKKLQKKNQNLHQQVETIIGQNNRAHQMLESERYTVKQLEEKINIMWQQQKQNNQEIESLRQKISSYLTKVKNLQEQIRQTIIDKQKLAKDLQIKKQDYQHQNATKDQLIQQCTKQHLATKKNLGDKILQQENQIIQKEKSIKILQFQKKTLQSTVKSQESMVEKLKQENKKIKSQKEAQKMKLQTQIKAVKTQKETLTKNYLTLEQQFKKQKETNQKYRKEKEAEKHKLQRQISYLQHKLKQNQQILVEKQKRYMINIQEKEEEIMRKNRQNQQMICQIQRFRSILKPMYKVTNLPFQQDNMEQGIGNHFMNKILRGSYFQESIILNQTDPHKTYFLYKQLSTFLSIPTFNSQMLFKYDPQNPQNNFFKYITDIKNIMLLVKLVNGTIIGGFTVFPFEKEVQRPGKGFIFSLTAERIFKMKREPRVAVTSNDPFFLIIGSSQLRIKYNQKKIFSNFGVSTATFDSNGFTKQQFLGTKQNISDVEFQTFQIYAINAEKQ